MRTIQTPVRSHGVLRKAKSIRTPSFRAKQTNPSNCRFAVSAGVIVLYALLFVLGYLPGIFLGRSGDSELGQELATYYTNTVASDAWIAAFCNQALMAFLQHFSILLCGFSPFGGGFLLLFFGGKGMLLGFCAANILAIGGTKALCFYWLLWFLPGLVILLLSLWLAGYAIPVSRGLFQSAFQGGAPRGQLGAAVRRLCIRFATAIFFSCLFSAVFSGVSIFVIRFLR